MVGQKYFKGKEDKHTFGEREQNILINFRGARLLLGGGGTSRS